MTRVPVPSPSLAALALDPAEELSLDWVGEAPACESAAPRGLWLRVLCTALALVGCAMASATDAPPAPPYYSVEIATAATEAAALDALKPYANVSYARVEKRKSGYIVRVGAWKTRAEAERMQDHLKGRGAANTRIRQIEHPAPWILPGAAAEATPPPVVVKRPAATPPSAPPVVVAPPAAAPRPAVIEPAVAEAPSGDLTELSLAELMDVKVTSVSKHAEPLKQAAGAIFVLSGDEIRRSGVHRIAQALRMVPGLQVYQTNAQTFNVTSRGFGTDKLEVLLDGRSVYTPLTSTVFWDTLDTYLNDIDRIEVIRGPGATLWGANAVNGVINIVTRRAQDTVGTEVIAGGGFEERDFGAFRTGSRIGDSGYGRLYAKAFERDHSIQRTGAHSIDGERQGQGGFRTDWNLAADQDLTVSGDFYKGDEPAASLVPGVRGADATNTGANLLARWGYRLAPDSEVSVQAYYDGYHRVLPMLFEDKVDTGDLQVQHRFRLFDANVLTYGAGYRGSRDQTAGPPAVIIFTPASRTLQTYSAFLQDQQQIGEGGELTVGSKFEHNSYTGFEVQPGIRLGWTLGADWFTWGAISRAVRLPNRIDTDIALFCPPPFGFPGLCAPNTTLVIGNPHFKSEKLIAYEWGLRFFAARDLFADLATYYNHYTDLRSTETTPPPFGAFDNKFTGNSYGGELSLAWSPVSWLDVRPFVGYVKIDIDSQGSTDPVTDPNLEGGTPHETAGLRLNVSPGYGISTDAFLRYMDSIGRQQVPAYTELNVRVSWKVLPSLEIGVTGQNLLDSHHPEAGTAPSATNPAPPPPATEIERAGWLDLTWRWH